MSGNQLDPYEVLGLTPEVAPELIKKRYRDLARRYHPDVDPSGEAAEKIRAVNDAYHILGDPERRVAYDLQMCSRLWGTVTLVNRTSRDELEAHLRYWQFRIFLMEGASIRNAATLFEAAQRDLPRPFGGQIQSWESLEDGLWQGLADFVEDHGQRRIAFVWTNVHQMLRSGLADLLLAIDTFRGLSGQLATTDHGFPCPTALRTFLIGEGPNFPAWHLNSQGNESARR